MSRVRRLSIEELTPYLLPLSEPAAPFDWRTVFGNDHPVELEVGFGKGLFLLSASQARPEVNFVGVEIVRKYQLFTAARLAKRQLRHVRVACADACVFLRDFTPAASLQAVHVYFPDPWWKRRHRKRRVFTEEFVRSCVRILRPGGCLHIATDVAEYFGVMSELLSQEMNLRPLPTPNLSDANHDMDYLTNFERKFRKEGKPIYRGLYARS